MCVVGVVCVFCCFKQKTAYEMRISDWSSDVCSSDLILTTSGSFGGVTLAALVFGNCSGTPTIISGAATMKMISSTSMTSTSGVTLMSDRDRKSDVSGKRVSVRVDLGGRRISKKKTLD